MKTGGHNVKRFPMGAKAAWDEGWAGGDRAVEIEMQGSTLLSIKAVPPTLAAENQELRECLAGMLELLHGSARDSQPLQLTQPFVERCYRATELHRRRR